MRRALPRSFQLQLVQAGFRVAICEQVEDPAGINFLNVSIGNFLISEVPVNEGRFDLVEDEITRMQPAAAPSLRIAADTQP